MLLSLFFPYRLDIAENEFYQPVATLFNSTHVVYFEEGADFAILQSTEMVDITGGASPNFKQGKVFYVLTKVQLARYEQTDAAGIMILCRQ
jgi:hypothetical protein